MRSRYLAALPLAPLLLLALVARGPARHAQTNAIAGTFVLDRAASDDIGRAIDRATAHMSFIKKPIARSRLKKTNEPSARLVFAPTPEHFSIAVDDGAPIVTPADGSRVSWTREDGEVFGVSRVWKDGRLRETFQAEDGSRENVFVLSPDGQTLTLDVMVTSPKLKEAVRYRLVYRRKG